MKVQHYDNLFYVVAVLQIRVTLFGTFQCPRPKELGWQHDGFTVTEYYYHTYWAD